MIFCVLIVIFICFQNVIEEEVEKILKEKKKKEEKEKKRKRNRGPMLGGGHTEL